MQDPETALTSAISSSGSQDIRYPFNALLCEKSLPSPVKYPITSTGRASPRRDCLWKLPSAFNTLGMLMPTSVFPLRYLSCGLKQSSISFVSGLSARRNSPFAWWSIWLLGIEKPRFRSKRNNLTCGYSCSNISTVPSSEPLSATRTSYSPSGGNSSMESRQLRK